MKRFVKKLYAAGLSAAVMLSAAMPVGVSAATFELINEDFVSQTELSGWTYSNSKGNSALGDAFKLSDDGLEIYTGQNTNGVDTITKSFQAVNNGDTLKITGSLSLNGLDWSTGQSAAIKIGNGAHNWSLLQLYNSGNSAPNIGAAAKDAIEHNGWGVTGNKFDLSNLQWGFDSIKEAALNYSASLAPSENGYILTASLGASSVEDVSIELTEEEALSLDRIYIAVGANNDAARRLAIKLGSLKVERVVSEKPVLSFGENILFDNSGERIGENFAAWSNFSGITTDNAEYARGAKWLYSNTENKGNFSETFKLSEKLEVYAGAHNGGVEKIEKKFSPISGGETLKITGTLSMGGLAWNTGRSISLKIGSGEHNWSLLQLYNSGSSSPNVGAAEKDTIDHNGWGVTGNKFDLSNLQWGFDSIKDSTINYSATLAPSENGYILTASLGVSGVEDVSIELTEEEALSIDRIYIASGFCNASSGASCGLKIYNLNVEAIGTNNALKNGKNTLYVPLKNLNGEAADMTVIAALCNADGTQEAFALKDYKGIINYNQNLSIDIDVRDSSTQYVRVFIFDSAQTMVPLTGAKSTKN